MGCTAEAAKCVVHLGRSYPRDDPSCSGLVPTAKTTLNPAHVRPARRALHNEPRLDDTIKPLRIPSRCAASTASLTGRASPNSPAVATRGFSAGGRPPVPQEPEELLSRAQAPLHHFGRAHHL